MNERIGALVKTSLVDYPGKICATIFLKHCNLRCPYCYNGPIVNSTADSKDLVTLDAIYDHLLKRKNILDGVVLSGGEALLNPNTKKIIEYSKNLGYKIKLDTNGTLPLLLENIINNEETRPDFIAMDIKTSPAKYHFLLNNQNTKDKTNYQDVLAESIKIISSYPAENREFRTVLVPTLIKKEDIKIIAQMLPKDAVWQFAQFRNENCLEPLYNSLTPYTDDQAKELVLYAKTFIKAANLR